MDGTHQWRDARYRLHGDGNSGEHDGVIGDIDGNIDDNNRINSRNTIHFCSHCNECRGHIVIDERDGHDMGDPRCTHGSNGHSRK